MRSAILALATAAAATAPAAAHAKVEQPPKAKLAKPDPKSGKRLIIKLDAPAQSLDSVDSLDLIVPAPALPPQIVIVRPELAFGDARAYPHGMLLLEPPRSHRVRLAFVEVVADADPDPTWPALALGGCALAALGGFALARRRPAGSLAHPIGML